VTLVTRQSREDRHHIVSIQTLLQQVPLFSGFDARSLDRLATRCGTRDYPAGHVLFTTGEPCRGLYIVETGRVQIYRTSATGRKQVLHSEGPGRAVAELPLLDGGPYPATAATETESRLVYVPREDFEALYRENPDVAHAIIQGLAERLRHLVQVTETLAFRDVAARLALFLAEYADQHGTQSGSGIEIVLTQTREQLSTELGTARESVSRAFRQLREKGVIESVGRNHYRIPDMRRLRTLCRPGERPNYER
jgi:CRP/FNR family transcriptional regulator